MKKHRNNNYTSWVFFFYKASSSVSARQHLHPSEKLYSEEPRSRLTVQKRTAWPWRTQSEGKFINQNTSHTLKFINYENKWHLVDLYTRPSCCVVHRHLTVHTPLFWTNEEKQMKKLLKSLERELQQLNSVINHKSFNYLFLSPAASKRWLGLKFHSPLGSSASFKPPDSIATFREMSANSWDADYTWTLHSYNMKRWFEFDWMLFSQRTTANWTSRHTLQWCTSVRFCWMTP